MNDEDRHIPFEQVFNFRDLGGYVTGDGRVLRPRRVFRSGGLHRMTARDRARATQELALRTVIDLRALAEAEQVGSGAFVDDPNVTHHKVPFTSPPSPWPEEPGRRMSEAVEGLSGEERTARILDVGVGQYMSFLERSGEAVNSAFGILADSRSHPVVFHCGIGRDRTGLLAALLLDALGVDEETIVEDYALSEGPMATFREFIVGTGALTQEQVSSPGFGVYPEMIRGTLERLSERHGSAGEYLRECGVGEQTLENLRQSLLE